MTEYVASLFVPKWKRTTLAAIVRTLERQVSRSVKEFGLVLDRTADRLEAEPHYEYPGAVPGYMVVLVVRAL